MLAQVKGSDIIYEIEEGTGDNLLNEDIEEGYVDYIYYSVYSSLEAYNNGKEEIDGGMILLKIYYIDLTPEEILEKVEEFENVKLEVIEE